jgi:hypothetical protein
LLLSSLRADLERERHDRWQSWRREAASIPSSTRRAMHTAAGTEAPRPAHPPVLRPEPAKIARRLTKEAGGGDPDGHSAPSVSSVVIRRSRLLIPRPYSSTAIILVFLYGKRLPL